MSHPLHDTSVDTNTSLQSATVNRQVVFPNFAAGVGFMIEIAKRRLQPASIRLIDNEQFQFGHALKPAADGMFQTIMDTIKTFYVTQVRATVDDARRSCSLPAPACLFPPVFPTIYNHVWTVRHHPLLPFSR